MGAALLICCLLFNLVGCSRQDATLKPLAAEGLVLAFGDSLTKGTGAPEQQSYPAHLSRLIERRVINAGVPGELSRDGVERLSAVLDEFQPTLVLICHGGNDVLQRRDRFALRTNLQQMVETVQAQGIDVVLIAVPKIGLLASDLDLYANVAKQLHVPLLEEKLGELLFAPEYKSDAVHLNGKGYGQLAQAVAELLEEYGAL